jgi:hypothetical protein
MPRQMHERYKKIMMKAKEKRNPRPALLCFLAAEISRVDKEGKK